MSVLAIDMYREDQQEKSLIKCKVFKNYLKLTFEIFCLCLSLAKLKKLAGDCKQVDNSNNKYKVNCILMKSSLQKFRQTQLTIYKFQFGFRIDTGNIGPFPHAGFPGTVLGKKGNVEFVAVGGVGPIYPSSITSLVTCISCKERGYMNLVYHEFSY